MNRIYTDVSTFRAPFDHVEFAGLGEFHPAPTPPLPGNWPVQWPRGRSYIDVAQHRMPYRSGYYQDNTLFGLGDAASDAATTAVVQGAVTQAAYKRGLLIGGLAGAAVMWLLTR